MIKTNQEYEIRIANIMKDHTMKINKYQKSIQVLQKDLGMVNMQLEVKSKQIKIQREFGNKKSSEMNILLKLKDDEMKRFSDEMKQLKSIKEFDIDAIRLNLKAKRILIKKVQEKFIENERIKTLKEEVSLLKQQLEDQLEANKKEYQFPKKEIEVKSRDEEALLETRNCLNMQTCKAFLID